MNPEQVYEPGEEGLKEWCDLGYTKNCPCLPEANPVDALRLAMIRDKGRMMVTYVLETDHRLGERGTLAYDANAQCFLNTHANPVVQRQVEAYVECFLRRKAAPARLCSPWRG